ncbi:MAG: ABC transporter ATP-binding protein [Bacteroidales bacterium]|nr:ABC transporter ATP-binding protein [Bacteroidales bacterium]
MTNDIAIKVKNLSKIYHLYNNPQDRVKEALNPFKKSYHHDFYAMDDVSFEIKKGETVGIIGKNGAGKSTLLKMITGVLSPSSGSVEIDGKIASLLELGAGFNPEMTGLENIYLNGTLMGFTKKEMDTKVDAIFEFADIGEFIYQPVKTYSSGMFARLAFSLSIAVEPDILIVDEVLSVGDMRFQQKCFRFFESFKKNHTLIYVSHDMNSVLNLCDKAIWINNGTLISEGIPKDVSEQYIQDYYENDEVINQSITSNSQNFSKETIYTSATDWIEKNTIKISSFENVSDFGSKSVEIIDVEFLNKDSEYISEINGDEDVELCITAVSKIDVNNPAFGIMIKNYNGQIILDMSSYYPLLSHDPYFNKNTNIKTIFKFKLPLIAKGEYTLSVAIADGDAFEHNQLHWINDCLVLNVIEGPFMQSATMPSNISVKMIKEINND